MARWNMHIMRAGGALLFAILATQCTQQPAPTSGGAVLLGEMKPDLSVKEIMKYLIDPLSDNIFNAVGTIVTVEGVTDKVPTSDDEWASVKSGAVALAEGANLLKVRRPFAPAGDLNNSGGANAPELSPAQIAAKVDADLPLWNKNVEALRTVALDVMRIVEKKDTKGLFDAGEALDHACENCHLEYWYPGDRKRLGLAPAGDSR